MTCQRLQQQEDSEIDNHRSGYSQQRRKARGADLNVVVNKNRVACLAERALNAMERQCGPKRLVGMVRHKGLVDCRLLEALSRFLWSHLLTFFCTNIIIFRHKS